MSNEEKPTTTGEENKEEDTTPVELDRKRLMDAAKFLIQDADKAFITNEGKYCLEGYKYRIECDHDELVRFVFCGRDGIINHFIEDEDKEAQELWRDIKKKVEENEVEKKSGMEHKRTG